jgi:hypothetical protein
MSYKIAGISYKMVVNLKKYYENQNISDIMSYKRVVN